MILSMALPITTNLSVLQAYGQFIKALLAGHLFNREWFACPIECESPPSAIFSKPFFLSAFQMLHRFGFLQ
ncbi:MAG: hypothetical protein ACJ75B_21265 [Flavisolibacter sp.]